MSASDHVGLLDCGAITACAINTILEARHTPLVLVSRHLRLRLRLRFLVIFPDSATFCPVHPSRRYSMDYRVGIVGSSSDTTIKKAIPDSLQLAKPVARIFKLQGTEQAGCDHSGDVTTVGNEKDDFLGTSAI